jgi:pimeloyl-ACP methyl ester carboxylesterase
MCGDRLVPMLVPMRRHTLAAAAALMAVAGPMVIAAPASATVPSATVTWKKCPTYSDKVVEYLLPPADRPAFHALWARAECGTVTVPLDYGKPLGRTITVALTRLKATDQQRRLGSMALNPGGPGGAGYLLPIQVGLRPDTAKLNERYDLIGFDPRGIGYSTQVNCEPTNEAPPTPPITRQQAKQQYAELVRANQACAATDPEFLTQATTGNIARDLDRIRAGLGERKLSYFGVSWGSWLGPVYRSLFPGKAGRMWVDSIAIPDPRVDRFEAERSMATHRSFLRFAAWIARFDDTYHLGRTSRQVETTLAAMRADFEANPRQFTDLPFPIGGFEIGLAAGVPSVDWPLFARTLADLRTWTGTTAPESLKRAIGEPGPGGEPPAGLPELYNQTAGQAIFCNDDGGRRDFDSAWNAYQDRLRRYPVTGLISNHLPICAGWPRPTERIRLHHAGGALVLSGHRWETPSVFEWTAEMHDAVGGKVVTVDDDVHGSVMYSPDCIARVARFFETGSVGARTCEGAPMPTGPEDVPEPAAFGSRARSALHP